ncbi:DUF309 domain-containing protein [Paenibacillus glycanilyticus]|uniref:DUF309 domain-containing protein n=1 Tax=Paenibacillus glycanilyticus TaxID=126569 RepID=A0ABQ6GKL4_9BACL|nr:DUF309 domain-containing protein [Paenibacillus glycanilyticus]GLX71469.1 hypothetical protein MU1_58190 [Paenibacillus glycanilyticus]
MTYPSAYVSYLVQFNGTRDFFECHELLEEYWKEHPGDPRSAIWVGLIQLAVGLYHERRGNWKGAIKMYEKALEKLGEQSLDELGLDGARALADLKLSYERLHAGQGEPIPYQDMTLTVTDPQLEEQCLRQCQSLAVDWGRTSPLHEESLIHRHKLRDRSDVVAERAAAIEAKKRNRTVN